MGEIKLEPGTHWCPRHLVPFRETWPRGYLIASLRLFQLTVANMAIQKAAGYDEEKGTPAKTELLGGVLLEFSPLCCLLGDEETKRVTDLALNNPDALTQEIRDVASEWRSERGGT